MFRSGAAPARLLPSVPAHHVVRMRVQRPWLEALRARVDAWLEAGVTAVLACSALTEQSREALGTRRDGVELVFLDAPRALIAKRMCDREHFMPERLLESQLATLERPSGAIEIDAALPLDVLVEIVKASLGY